jgi:hypothetical protein
MKTYNYSTIEDFEINFEKDLVEKSTTIVQAIQEGINKNLTEVVPFAIVLESLEGEYIIKIKRTEWANALTSCLKHLEKTEKIDEIIDTYQLLQKLK